MTDLDRAVRHLLLAGDRPGAAADPLPSRGPVMSAPNAGETLSTAVRVAPRRRLRATREADHVLEHKTSTVLRRIGLNIQPEDRHLVRQLIPFVIDPESLHTIPPLSSVPTEYTVCPCRAGARDSFNRAPFDDLRYQNLALQPVPVLASSLAHFLVFRARDIEVEFIDGHNVYGANSFERHEGRRLLRRAIGYVHDEMVKGGDAFDIIAYESDGFLISTRRTPGAAPLKDRLRHIIARMNGDEVDLGAQAATRDRLATFYKHALGDVLAPATVSHESKDDLLIRLARQDFDEHSTIEDRFARLQARYESLSSLIKTIAERTRQEQGIVLTLLEYRMYDPVLEPATHDLGGLAYRVCVFRDPGELLKRVRNRPATFYHLELVSLLKAVNEHPLGGVLAGNEVLRVVYVFLITTLQQLLQKMGVDPAYELHAWRRWGDFFFCLDKGMVGAWDVSGALEDAFARAKYVAIERNGCHDETRYSVALTETCPPPDGSRILMPLITAVSTDIQLSEDILSMPIEQPGPNKLRAISKRLNDTAVPDLDIAFLADWPLNACDPNRGIPRLVNLLHATHEDIGELAQNYESYVNRKGNTSYRIRREAPAIHGFKRKLRDIVAGIKNTECFTAGGWSVS